MIGSCLALIIILRTSCLTLEKHVFAYYSFVSLPEHEVLMVSYCGQWLSVVRRRPSSVVRRPSTFDVYMSGQKLGHQVKSLEIVVYTLQARFVTRF